MRLSVLVLLLLCAGCARESGDDAAQARARAARAAAAAAATGVPLPDSALAGTDPAARPRVSPVPPFRGGGEDWQIQLHSARGLRHDVSLEWEGQLTPGLVEFRLPAGPTPGSYRLDGLLYTPQGNVGLSILIATGVCADASRPEAGRHEHTVQVMVQGRANLRGCGDLAAY